MRYDVIVTSRPEEVTISKAHNDKSAYSVALFKKNEQRDEVRICYKVNRVAHSAWLSISTIKYGEGNGSSVIDSSTERELPEDVLEEIGFLVKTHGLVGVYWNELSEIVTFSKDENRTQTLILKRVEGFGSRSRVTFHDKVGEYFYLDVDGLSYKAIPKDDIAVYLEQAKRLNSAVAIPDWCLVRDAAYKYSPLKQTFTSL